MDRVVPNQQGKAPLLETESFNQRAPKSKPFSYKTFIRGLKCGDKIGMVVQLETANNNEVFGAFVPIVVNEITYSFKEKNGKRIKIQDTITVTIDQTYEETLNLLQAINHCDLPPLLSRKSFEFDIKEHLGRANIEGFPTALVPKELVYGSNLIYRPLINNSSSAYRRVRGLFQIFQGRKQRFSKPAPMFPPPPEIKLPLSPITYEFKEAIKRVVQKHQEFMLNLRANKLDHQNISLAFYKDSLFFYSTGTVEYGRFELKTMTVKKTTGQKSLQRERRYAAKITLSTEELERLGKFFGRTITSPLYLPIGGNKNKKPTRVYYHKSPKSDVLSILCTRTEMLSLGKISGKSIEFPKTAYGLKLYQKQILDEYQEEIAKVKEDYESILAKYESEKIAYISTLEPQSSRAQTVRRANLIKNEIDNDIESVLEESNVDTTATRQPGKLSFSSTLKSPAKKNPEGINKRDSNYRNGDRAYRATRQTQIRASR